MFDAKTSARFDAKWIPEPNTGCFFWLGGTQSNLGYGKFRTTGAHRFAWMREHGPIPHGMQVMHKCNNPLCVNVEHLELGTAKQNTDYKMACKRQAKKLTEEQAREIRKSTEKLRVLADRYGVSTATIGHIRTGIRWSHI